MAENAGRGAIITGVEPAKRAGPKEGTEEEVSKTDTSIV